MRDILLVHIDLRQKRCKKRSRIPSAADRHRFRQLFPEKFAAIEHAPAAHVEQVHRQHAVFVVIAKNVHVVALHRGHALLFLQLLHHANQIAIFRRRFVFLVLRRRVHARPQGFRQLPVPPFQKGFHVAHRFRVRLCRRQAGHAWSQAALDVVLQAGTRMKAREIHIARGNQKIAMNQIHRAMRQVGGKIRAVIDTAILAQPPRHVYAGEALAQRQLDVGISFVIAQQHVEARFTLLDEVVLKRQRLFFVVNDDVLDVGRLAHQRAGLGLDLDPLHEIRAHPRPQTLRLANVDDLALGVLVQIHSGPERQGSNFFAQIHFLFNYLSS